VCLIDGHGGHRARLSRRTADRVFGSIAHKSDLGASFRTGYAQARELFQEGIQYPPVRLVSRGVMQRDIEAILRANSRTPDLIMGDIRARSASRAGRAATGGDVEKYGVDTVLDVFTDVHRVSEERLRARCVRGRRRVRGGIVRRYDGIDLDRRVRYHVRVEKHGDASTSTSPAATIKLPAH